MFAKDLYPLGRKGKNQKKRKEGISRGNEKKNMKEGTEGMDERNLIIQAGRRRRAGREEKRRRNTKE